jgi:DNA-directed RNA polymerase subunit alpha
MVADRSMTDDEALAAPLSVLRLNTRTTNALLNSGLSTIGDLVAKTEVEVWQLPQIGQTTLTHIKAKLSECGLALRPGDTGRPKWK